LAGDTAQPSPGVLEPLRDALARLACAGLRDPRATVALAGIAERLEQESARVPRAGVLARALRRCLALPPGEAARQLLKLLVVAEQLGTDAPPPPAPLPGPRLPASPSAHQARALPPLELVQLRAALARRTAPPRAVLDRLSEPDTAADPRVWPLLADGLSHPFLREACADAIARLGDAWEPRLLAAFNRRGGSTDAARLRALSGIMGPRALGLLRTCARQASREVRREALEWLVRLDPDEASALLCERFDADPAGSSGLLDLLAASGSQPALRRLLRVLQAEQVLPPHAFARLPAAAMATWLSLAQREAPALTTGSAFFELLEGHPAPEARAFLRVHLDHPDPAVRRRAAHALLSAADPQSCAELVARGVEDPALEALGITACFALGPEAAFDALAPRIEALTLPGGEPVSGAGARAPTVANGDQRSSSPPLPQLPGWLTIALQLLGAGSDPRWRDALRGLARAGHPEVLRALRALGDPGGREAAASTGADPNAAAASAGAAPNAAEPSAGAAPNAAEPSAGADPNAAAASAGADPNAAAHAGREEDRPPPVKPGRGESPGAPPSLRGARIRARKAR